MSAETRRDIESEIGKNGNRLLTKIAAIMLLPSLGGLFWLGFLHAEVANNVKRLDVHSNRITVNEASARIVALQQASVVQNLKGLDRGLDDLAGRLDKIYNVLLAIRQRAEDQPQRQ